MGHKKDKALQFTLRLQLISYSSSSPALPFTHASKLSITKTKNNRLQFVHGFSQTCFFSQPAIGSSNRCPKANECSHRRRACLIFSQGNTGKLDTVCLPYVSFTYFPCSSFHPDHTVLRGPRFSFEYGAMTFFQHPKLLHTMLSLTISLQNLHSLQEESLLFFQTFQTFLSIKNRIKLKLKYTFQ